MRILYNQSQLKRSLVLGIVFVVIGLLSLLTTAKLYLSGLGGIGIMYIVNYFYFKNKGYVILTNDSISKNEFFKKRIDLKNIESLKYFAGDYIIKGKDGEISIDTNLVDKESLTELKKYFDDLMREKEPAANTR